MDEKEQGTPIDLADGADVAAFARGKRSDADYQELLEMAVYAGEIMMASGAETHRVEDTVARILATAHAARAETFVISTGMTISLTVDEDTAITMTRRVKSSANNLGRIYEVNRVSRSYCGGEITVREAMRRLQEIEKRCLYGSGLRILGMMLTSAAFSVTFGGTLPDALGALLCGLVLGVVIVFSEKHISRPFVVTALAALLMTVSATGICQLANNYLQLSLQAQYLIVGAMMPIVPGVAITNAIRDMLAGDYVSACSRVLDAFLTAAAVAVGVGCGIAVSEALELELTTLDFVFVGGKTVGLHLLWNGIAAFLACFAFGFLLDVPRHLVLPSAGAATFCWVIYLLVGNLGFSAVWAALVASALLYLLSYGLARLLRAPVSVFLIVGILPLVPGVHIYRTVYSMITGEGSTSEALVFTLMMAGAIALGVFIADLINELATRAAASIRARLQRKKG